MTELQILQWSMGILGSMFVTGVGAIVWLVWRLQQIPEIAKRQDDISKEVSRLTLAYVRVEEHLKNLDEDMREARSDIRSMITTLQRMNGNHDHMGGGAKS